VISSTTAFTTPSTTLAVNPVDSTTPLVSTSTLDALTSIISADPSTTYVAPATTAAPPPPATVVTQVTSVITPTVAPGTDTGGAIITTIYSTQAPVTITPAASDASTLSSTTSSASSTRSALSASGGGNSSSKGGLGSGATIAIAVIIPIVAVVGLVIFGLWFWRKRKAKKDAEELRKNEMAEYGFNPNNDPSLPVGVAAYTDGGSEGNDDSGYRGWGATTASASNRKASTTLGSNSRAAAMGGASAMSDGGSQGGHTMQHSPSTGGSDGMSQDPLVHGNSYGHGYPDAATAGAAGSAAIGGAALAGGARNRNSQAVSSINRGPSNASSAYSGHGGIAPSEASSDIPDMPRPYYQEEVPYNIYNDVQPGHGPYGDGTYGAENDQPVIRDVQARRNTRIERAPTFPQQGGIAQNF